MSRFTVHHGDSLEVLRTVDSASIDAVVTDPPYGISYLAKKWDYDVPEVAVWAECLRVLKPGGHVLAFAGSRTQHKMASRIEDAGFDIRDMIAWVYGSGFPKSLDMGKAMDASDRLGFSRDRSLRFTEFMRATGLTAAEINTAKSSSMGSHYLTNKTGSAVATEPMFAKLRPLIADKGMAIPDDIENLVAWRVVVSENMKRRTVTSTRNMVDTSQVKLSASRYAQDISHRPQRVVNITEAASDDAKRWQGWGSALKPAIEPITVARKPFKGSLTENVKRHGVGALNVDGCRIGAGSGADGSVGKFPANLIHDGSEEVLRYLPINNGKSAARFFYCAKTSACDRNEGTANNHPTVKPTALMRYLCRLVTPRGGTVLDPYCGSGSTGKAAMLEGFSFVGIERDAEFVAISRERIGHALEPQPDTSERSSRQMSLFDAAVTL